MAAIDIMSTVLIIILAVNVVQNLAGMYRNVRILITLLMSCTWLPKMDTTMADQLEFPNDRRPFPASTKDSFKNRCPKFLEMFSICILITFVAL